jgi:hypothetical protein
MYEVKQDMLRGGLLGATTKLRNETTSFVLFVRMEQLDSHWTDFTKFDVSFFFRKYVEKVQVPLKSDKNNGYFT